MAYIGQVKAKKEMEQILDLGLAFPERKTIARTVLLYGSSGVGKTELIRNLAEDYEINFYSVSPADIYGKYIGESEANLRSIFETAYENQPALIFFDEIEVLISNRLSGESECQKRLQNELLTLLEGFNQRFGQVWIVGASNLPAQIDASFKSRFKRFIRFDMPNDEERAKMIQSNCQKNNVELAASEEDLKRLARNTVGFSHRDMRNLMEKSFQIGPEHIVYSADHFKVDQTEEDYDIFSPCCCPSAVTCNGVKLKYSDIPEDALKWPTLTVKNIQDSLYSTPKTNDVASKRSIEEFERGLGQTRYNLQNQENKSRLPLGMIILTTGLFILLIVVLLYLLGVY